MGRIYSSCKEAISEEMRNVFELGTEVQSCTSQDKDVRNNEDFKTKEIIGETFTITDTSDFEEMHDYMQKKLNIDFNKKWCDAEFEERISDRNLNPGKAYKFRKTVWDEFMHNGKFAYSYNERIKKYKKQILEQLRINPTSRQAVIPVFEGHIDTKNLGGKRRIPCSMFYQFLIRKDEYGKDKLQAIYIMRSSDLLTHWVNDLYLAIKLQKWIAKEIGMESGSITMFISSFHSYFREMKKYKVF